MSYKFNNPYEWLMKKSNEWDELQLRVELQYISGRLDFDTIQDMYQSDMDKDGYFDEE